MSICNGSPILHAEVYYLKMYTFQVPFIFTSKNWFYLAYLPKTN